METKIRTNYGPNSKRLLDFLKEKEIGSFVSFKELSAVAGIDITNPRLRFVFEAARRPLRKYFNKILVSVRGEGYSIADFEQTVSASAAYRKRSYNSAQAAYEIIKTVDLTNLSEKDQQKAITESHKASCLLVIYKATENAALNGSQQVCIQPPSESDCLRLLLSNKNS